jgi:hypothetical protein
VGFPSASNLTLNANTSKPKSINMKMQIMRSTVNVLMSLRVMYI